MDKENYKIGATLTVYFNVDRELYVQLFIINSIGEISLLFPNPFQANNLLTPEVTYQVPPENAKFTLDISAPLDNDIIPIDKQGHIIKTMLVEPYVQFQAVYYIN